MKGLVWVLAVCAIAVAVSLALRGSGGYALFVLHPWRAELPLNLLAVLLVLVFLAAYFLVRLMSHTLRLPSHVRAFRKRRRDEKGRNALLGAIRALFEGRFERVEKLATGARELGAAPALAGLLAARAAQRRGDSGRRDQWLERAKGDEESWRLARLMTEAELLLEERRFDAARKVLRELHGEAPRHAGVLQLLLRAEQGLADWDEVLRIVKLLEKKDIMSAETLEHLRINAWLSNLSRKTLSPEELAQCWEEVPRSERSRVVIATAAARAFMRSGDCRKAHRIIEDALEREWDGALVELYGECIDEDALERLERAEKWLGERPGDADLLLALGRLCAQRQLWGKAQSYLEASLASKPGRAAHVALARLFDRIGRTEDADRHFRESAGLGASS
ncbi:MAG: heme biosynthesis HemY N-terminal domain-containing protein [Burkholderiales bacterium]